MLTKNLTHDHIHHHVRRGYHTLTFITSVVLVAFFGWILGIALASVSAQSPSSGLNENIATLDFASSDVKVVSKEAFAGELEKEDPATPSLIKEASITAIPADSIQQKYVLQDNEVQPIFIFKTQYPKFIGQTSITSSEVALDIYGSVHVIGNTKVDSNGNWGWGSTVPLKPGVYTFNAKAVQGQPGKTLAKDTLLFEVVLDANDKLVALEFNNTPQLGNGGVLFDVRAVIPKDHKTLSAGSDVKVDIRFVNFGSPNKAVDVEVQYTITNEQDEIISQNSETMAVKDELVFSKSFLTASSLPAGKYTLTVAVPSEDLIATATDTFQLASNDEATTAQTTSQSPLENKLIVMELLGALMFLGLIIAYMEYNKVVILSKHIKQLGTKDLLKASHR